MTTEGWQHVKELFEATRDAAPLERESALHGTADPEVVHEVKLLLESYDQSRDFLEEPVWVENAAELPSALISPLVGTRFGPYMISRQVGEGGMGIVCEAYRADGQFDQRVAIKLMKSWLVSEADLLRFRAERQILADLDHPHIARLLDGGATPDGVPYLVMEFVEGQPLDEYCRSQKPSLEQRLRLFGAICDAVHYAHTNGIIHRDLKPANVLVTAWGTPKLLDFGIAKALTAHGATPRTATMNAIATPLYASPEQLRGEAVTPATDIYSLGVMLYELLTGTHPYRSEGEAIHSIAKAVCEKDPEKPSKRAGEKGWARNLDHIVLKAMQKKAEERYQSAAELSHEIRRVADRRPVSIRAPFFSYQVRRAIQRMRAPAAVALALFLIAGVWWWKRESATTARHSLAVLGFQNLSADPGAGWVGTALTEMAATQLASSERIRVVSSEIVSQMQRDVKGADARAYTRAELDRLRKRLKVDYFVTGSYLARAGSDLQVYVRLQNAATGEIVAASTENGAATALPTLMYEVVDDLLRNGGASKAGLARTGNALQPFANPESARLYAQGLDAARHYDFRGAVAALAKAVAADPGNPLAHSAYGAALETLGYEEMAAQQAKLAYDSSAALPREERLSIAARYHASHHDYVSAITASRTLCELFPDNLEYGLRLASYQTDAGRPNDALATVAALRNRQQNNDPDARIELAEAKAAELQSNYNRMLAAASRASAAARRINANSELARAELTRGDAFYDLDRLDEALAAYRTAEQIDRDRGNTFGLASILVRQGRVYWKQGNFAANREYDENALMLFRKIGNRSAVPRVLNNLALSMRQQGDLEGALKIFEHAIAEDRELGEKKGLASTLNNAGNILRRLNRPDEARRDYEECLAIAVQLNDRTQIARSNLTLASLDADNGDLVAASERLQEALSTAGDSSSLRMAILQHLGEVRTRRGDVDGALQAWHESQDLARKLKAAQFEADTNLMMAVIVAERKQRVEAEQLISAARAYYVRQKERDALWEADLADARVRLASGDPNGRDTEILEAASGFHSIKSPARETEAYALLAASRLAQANARGAADAIRSGRAPSLAAHEYFPRIEFRLQSDRVSSALGNRGAAVRDLKTMLAELETKGWSGLASRTRDALAESSQPVHAAKTANSKKLP